MILAILILTVFNTLILLFQSLIVLGIISKLAKQLK